MGVLTLSEPTTQELMTMIAPGAQTDDERALAELVVKTLNLEVAAADIDPEAPLYGEGLGLDSIDMLEISLGVSQKYGVKLRADDQNNLEIFQSLRKLNQFIQAQIGH
jgi:acyl carrier protein